MKYSSIPSARLVVQHCKSRGIKHIVISPGSRNAPLTLGFTADPFFSCYRIVDERCAAFFGLGIAQQLREAIALVCTSGTALLNYYPAVAEAWYSNLPLVVISADRPPHKIDIGDGQTIRQENVLNAHVAYSGNLRPDAIRPGETRNSRSGPATGGKSEEAAHQDEIDAYNAGTVRDALSLAVHRQKPVHLNVPFEEPLYQMAEQDEVPIPRFAPHAPEKLENVDALAAAWTAAERKMVLAGTNYPGTVAGEYLEFLGNDPSVVVFTETTSNLHHPNFFPGIDNIIAPLELAPDPEVQFRKLQPEILLTFGGMVVSKKIKAFLRKYKPLKHWHIDPYSAYDTFFSLTCHIKMPVDAFFEQLLPLVRAKRGSYFKEWLAIRNDNRMKRSAYLAGIPFSDLQAFGIILGNIPENYQLQLANSSAVRYAQLFELDPSLKVFCNRGTSGIDGSTSTAIGAALYSETPTLLLTGDLSFLYDSNGLWNNYTRSDFRIIVINNGGGGIFRILPGRKESPVFDTFFETVQQLDLKKVCELYGIGHRRVSREAELTRALETFYAPSATPRLLEVVTPRLINDKILLGYFDFLSYETGKPVKNTEVMSNKREELVQKYAEDIREKFGNTPDMALLEQIARGLGPAIYNRDSGTVSGTDDKELETVKNNFLVKKLGLPDSPELMTGIREVLSQYGATERTKYRAVVYYMLARRFNRESVYR